MLYPRRNLRFQFSAINWDRNYEEYWIWENAVPLQPYDPHVFFRMNRVTVTYKGNMEWNIVHPNDEEMDHMVEVDVFGLDPYWHWAPLEESGCAEPSGRDSIPLGYVEIGGESSCCQKNSPTHSKRIHWTELPDSTRVGWRGPMMYWDYLKDAPPIYFEK